MQGPTHRERILLLAPTGRDARAACALIERAGLGAKSCSAIDELHQELVAGAGAAVIAEEALLGNDLVDLLDWVEQQPPWSDFPFIILTTRHDGPRLRAYTTRLVDILHDVTLQERPIQTVTLVSAVQAALRARQRQYEAAKYLEEREQAASRLEDLVHERTRQLQAANDRLTFAQESLTMALEAGQMRIWHLDLTGDWPQPDPSHAAPSFLGEWSKAVGERLLPEDRPTFEAALAHARDTGKFVLGVGERTHAGPGVLSIPDFRAPQSADY